MNTMNNYEYNEGIEFNGLMPKVMEADGIETIGASDFNAKLFENGHLGGGSLEVVDFFGTAFGGNGGGGKDSHEYVDLGLPSGTLWATENIKDANGNELYFAWGETQGYTAEQVGTDKNFVWDADGDYPNDYAFGPVDWDDETNYGMTKYNNTDNKTELESTDDAATANWGSGWRMPTKEQFEELTANTEYEWTEVDGVQSAKFTSTVKGHTDQFLFFPAANNAELGEVNGDGDCGYCWSISLNDEDVYNAFWFYFRDGDCGVYSSGRYFGFSVRPVRSSN